MKKEAGVLELIVNRLEEYGPQAAMIGAGLAGLSHYMYASNMEEKEKNQKENDKSIYVDVDPSKMAADGSQYLLDAGIGGGVILGAGTAGYVVVDKILQKIRKKELDKDLSKSKSEYEKLLSQRISKEQASPEDKRAGSELTYPNIEALCYAVAISELDSDVREKVATVTDPTYATLAMSMPSLAALVGGVLAHNYWYDRQKNIDAGLLKKEKEEERKTPTKIKLRYKEDKGKKEEPKEPLEEKGASGDSPLTEEEASMVNALNGNLYFTGKEKDDNTEEEKKNVVDKTLHENMVEPIDHNTTVVHTENGDTVVEAQDAIASKVLGRAQDIIAKNLAMTENVD